MEEEHLIDLLQQGDESALEVLNELYGGYLHRIAYNILHDDEDCRECVNDTIMAAWKSVGIHKPEDLAAYLAKIARRIAIDRLRKRHVQKRIPEEVLLSIAELEACIPDPMTVEDVVLQKELAGAVNCFLRSQKPEQRQFFVSRYWYCCSIKEIALTFGCSQTKVKNSLLRTRRRLRAYLEKEEFMP